MTNELKNLSRNLADNLIALREKRRLSQAALARLAGIPRSTLTNLESGAGNPSLGNLSKLSAVLQVSFEELLAQPRATVKLIRYADVPTRKRGSGDITLFKLLPDPIPGMEIDRMELGVGERMGGIPHTPNTKEYLSCVQGELTVYVAGGKHRLEPGDVLAFPGDQPHSYHNLGTRKAVGFSVVALAPPGT